jgi:hypothetical protein
MSVQRVLSPVRTGTAALAVAVALALLLKVPLIATFRAAVIVLAALEVLAFGQRVLSAGAGVGRWVEIAVKLAVLAAAYVAVGG